MESDHETPADKGRPRRCLFLAISRKALRHKALRLIGTFFSPKSFALKDLRQITQRDWRRCYQTGKITGRYKYLNPRSLAMNTIGYFIGDYGDEDEDDFEIMIFLDL